MWVASSNFCTYACPEPLIGCVKEKHSQSACIADLGVEEEEEFCFFEPLKPEWGT